MRIFNIWNGTFHQVFQSIYLDLQTYQERTSKLKMNLSFLPPLPARAMNWASSQYVRAATRASFQLPRLQDVVIEVKSPRTTAPIKGAREPSTCFKTLSRVYLSWKKRRKSWNADLYCVQWCYKESFPLLINKRKLQVSYNCSSVYLFPVGIFSYTF